MTFLGLDLQLASALLTAAQLTVCPLQDAPRVEAYLSYDPPVYNSNYNSATLKESMAKEKDGIAHTTDDGTMIKGVTVPSIRHRVNTTFSTLTDKQGNVCLYPSRIVINIYYAAGVFISSDVKDLDCTYKITMAHENQHVRYAIQTLDEYLPRIQLEMMYYLRSRGYQGSGPMRRSDVAKAHEQIVREMVSAAEPMVDRMMQVYRTRQGSIDTAESYRKQSDICKKDHPVLLERYLKTHRVDPKIAEALRQQQKLRADASATK